MKRMLAVVIALALLGLTGQAYAQSWYDPDWQYRRSIGISNAGGTELTDYQVRVVLDSTFNFPSVNGDGSDLRVTAADGVTVVPFWIETWDPGAGQGSMWVKVPSIPAGGTTIFVYYGNPEPTFPAPVAVSNPPTGPFTGGGIVVPAGDPLGSGQNLLPENIVYDEAAGTYWMVFANYRPGEFGIGLMSSATPVDPASWTWHGNILTDPVGVSFSPHLLKHDGTWYLFFCGSGGANNIFVSTSEAVTGPYSAPTVVLTPDAGTWEGTSLDGPYVFQRNDGKWIMLYTAGSPARTGYASADAIGGPYIKYAGNPVLNVGIPGTYDSAVVAHPWVIEDRGTWYIGYSAMYDTGLPVQIGYGTTTDWQTFTKHGVLFPPAPLGSGGTNYFRGAGTRIGNTYVLTYTAAGTGGFQAGIAIQPAVAMQQAVNNPDAVFAFYDSFDGSVLDDRKWSYLHAYPSQTAGSGGQMSLNATGVEPVYVISRQGLGMDYIVETRMQHPQQGTTGMFAQTGFTDPYLGDVVRISDGGLDPALWGREAKLGSQPDVWTDMAGTADQQWHTYRIYRKSPDLAGFRIDNNPVEEVTSADVPSSSLHPFLFSYGESNQVVADWIRARKYAEPEPVAALRADESTIPTDPPSSSKSGEVGALGGGGGGSGGGGCFIATAVYGSPIAPQVMVLRQFRDSYLLTNPLGTVLVGWYYRLSPPAARFIERHDTVRAVCRELLRPIIGAATHPVLTMFLLLGAAGLIVTVGVKHNLSRKSS